eukprot:UN05883
MIRHSNNFITKYVVSNVVHMHSNHGTFMYINTIRSSNQFITLVQSLLCGFWILFIRTARGCTFGTLSWNNVNNNSADSGCLLYLFL